MKKRGYLCQIPGGKTLIWVQFDFWHKKTTHQKNTQYVFSFCTEVTIHTFLEGILSPRIFKVGNFH